MDFWSRNGRPKLIAALEAACDTVQDDFAAVVQQQEARQASLLEEIEKLRVVAVRAEELEKENRSLVQELAELRKKHALDHADAAPPARPPLGEISANRRVGPLGSKPLDNGLGEKANLEREYSKLAKVHGALQERYQEIHRLAKKSREGKEKWEKYAISLEGKLKSLAKRLQRYENTGNQTPVPSSGRRLGSAGPSRDTALPAGTSTGSSAVCERGSEARIHWESDENVPEERAQEETEGADRLPPIPPDMAAAASPVAVKQEPSSDGPVIVSEKSLRKRKHQDEDEETPATSRRIKSEQSNSSDPVITAEVPTFRPHESMDFDEDDYGMPTPRKQRLREDEVASPMGDEVSLELHRTGRPVEKDAVHTPSPAQTMRPRCTTTAVLSKDKLERVHRGSRPPIRADWTLDGAIADVAEDTPEQFYSPKLRQGGKTPAHVTPAQGRLQSLLQHGSPEKNAALLRPTRQGRDGRTSPLRQDTGVGNTPQESRQRHDVPAKASPAPKASPNTHTPRQPQAKPGLPKPSRLRDRPLADLRPEDFKVNPKFNNGYTYAFDEVVRNKGERRELAGCTDPNCCGRQFRAMAESELRAAGSAILSRVADTRMMEEYLGDEAYRLMDMTREERQEVWLKAKTQDLADRMGRHRHRFARRPSPPGYWNPDFPSTQEIEERKEEGKRMERRVVEERWREAMRGGGAGRWLFRDE